MSLASLADRKSPSADETGPPPAPCAADSRSPPKDLSAALSSYAWPWTCPSTARTPDGQMSHFDIASPSS
jgi:hypothetical protein